jgi:hypothetical protein
MMLAMRQHALSQENRCGIVNKSWPKRQAYIQLRHSLRSTTAARKYSENENQDDQDRSPSENIAQLGRDDNDSYIEMRLISKPDHNFLAERVKRLNQEVLASKDVQPI